MCHSVYCEFTALNECFAPVLAVLTPDNRFRHISDCVCYPLRIVFACAKQRIRKGIRIYQSHSHFTDLPALLLPLSVFDSMPNLLINPILICYCVN